MSTLDTSNLQKGPQYNQPDQSQTLTNDPALQQVTIGPSGTSVVVDHDSLLPPGPSQQGIPGSARGHDAALTSNVESDSPQLVPGQFMGSTIAGQQFTKFLADYQEAFYPQSETPSGTASDFEESDNLSLFGFGNPPSDTTTTSENETESAGFFQGNLFDNYTTQQQPTLPQDQGSAGSEEPDTSQYTQETASTDPQVVYQGLLDLSGITTNTTLTPDQTSQLETSFQALAQQMAQANQSGSSELSSPDQSSLMTTFMNMLGMQTSTLSDDAKGMIYDFLQNVATAMSGENAVSQQQMQSELQTSTDPDTLYQILANLSGFKDDSTLTPEQKKALDAQLKALANDIAVQNQSGSPSSLESSDPSKVQQQLQQMLASNTTTPLPDDVQSELNALLQSAAGAIGSLNNTYETDFFKDLNSTDPTSVLEALEQMAGDVSGLSPDAQAALQAQLKQMATTIAEQNQTAPFEELGSPDANTVLTKLSALLQMSSLPSDIQTELTPVLKNMSIALAYLNTDQLNYVVNNSTDPTVTYNALVQLSNINNRTDLTPAEKTTAESYLTVMATALAFMSQLRNEISKLEATYAKETAAAKLQIVNEQVNVAIQAFNTTLQDIQTNIQATATQQAEAAKEAKHAKLMKWLMPTITALMCVVSIVLVVATLGVASPLAVAVIAATVALCAFTIADQQCNILGKMTDAMGVKNPVAAAAIKMAVMLAATALLMVATCGAAGPVLGLGVMGGLRAGAAAVTATGPMLAATVGIGLTVAMQSGLINEGFFAICKSAGMSDQDAMICTVALTIILMLLMMLVMGKVGNMGSIGSKGLTALPGMEEDAAASETTVGSAAASASTDGGATGAGMGGDTTATIGTTVPGKSGLTDLPGAGDSSIVLQQVGRGSGGTTDATAGATATDDATAATDDSATAAVSSPDQESVDAETPTGTQVGSTDSMGDLVLDSATPPSMSMRIMQVLIEQAKKLVTDPTTYTSILADLASILQAMSQIQEAKYNRTMSGISARQANIENELGQLNAALQYLNSLTPSFDVTINSLQDDLKSFMESYTSLLQMFEDMVQSSTSVLSNLHQKAG